MDHLDGTLFVDRLRGIKRDVIVRKIQKLQRVGKVVSVPRCGSSISARPQFAVPALQALIDSRHQVVALVSQPDRPKGRGHKLQPTPTKVVARRRRYPGAAADAAEGRCVPRRAARASLRISASSRPTDGSCRTRSSRSRGSA